MIDTIRIAYPLDDRLRDALQRFSSRLVRLSPSGEVLTESSRLDVLPSSFSGLWCGRFSSVVRDSFQEYVFFEFSLCKWCFTHNDKNYSLPDAVTALSSWVRLLSNVLHYKFKFSVFRLHRVDLAVNYLFESDSCDLYRFLDYLSVRFSRSSPDLAKIKYKSSLFFPSRWITKKLYCKHDELKLHKLKLSPDRIFAMRNMLRFEISFKRMFLKDAKMTKVFDFYKLKKRFETERKAFESAFEINRILGFESNSVRVNYTERYLIELVARLGFDMAKKTFISENSTRTFYRLKKSLSARGIALEYCPRLNLDDYSEKLDFTLKLAA